MRKFVLAAALGAIVLPAAAASAQPYFGRDYRDYRELRRERQFEAREARREWRREHRWGTRVVVVPPPRYGFYHRPHVVRFWDGFRWRTRIVP
jgi:hypothetical protein